jgi:hypothetical protein
VRSDLEQERQRFSRRTCRAAILLAFLLGQAGCALRFELAPETPHDRVVTERKPFFLWGLLPTQTCAVTDRCPKGAVAIAEEITGTDAALTVVTFGLYSPRSTTYYCRR